MQGFRRLFVVMSLLSIAFMGCADADHDLVCDPECGQNYTCEEGKCVAKVETGCSTSGCTDGLSCVNNNCVCVEGGQYKSCGAGLYCCSAGCKDLSTDTDNCGVCGNKCEDNERCIDKQCKLETTECSGSEKRCNGQVIEQCDKGMWTSIQTCLNSQSCDETTHSCVNTTCTLGSVTCLNNDVMKCNGTEWELYNDCEDATQTCNAETGLCDDKSVPCGNGAIDAGEDCDKTNLNGKTCASLSPGSTGTLTCNADCTFNKTQCAASVKCGNGDIDAGEDCDKTNLNGNTCANVVVGSTGSLSCNSDCTFNKTQCKTATFCVPNEGSCDANNVYNKCNATGSGYIAEETIKCGVDFSEAICSTSDICICNTDTDCKDNKTPACVNKSCKACKAGDKKCFDSKTYYECKPNNTWDILVCDGATPICDVEEMCVAGPQTEVQLLKLESFVSGTLSETTVPRIIGSFNTNSSSAQQINLGPWGKSKANLGSKAVIFDIGAANVTSTITITFNANTNSNTSAPNKIIIGVYDGDVSKLTKEMPVDKTEKPVIITETLTHNFSNMNIRIAGENTGATSETAGTLRIIPTFVVKAK